MLFLLRFGILPYFPAIQLQNQALAGIFNILAHRLIMGHLMINMYVAAKALANGLLQEY